MLFGLSSEVNGLVDNYEAADFAAINGAADAGGNADRADTDRASAQAGRFQSDVAHADLLTNLADAIHAREPDGLAAAKSELAQAAGEDVLVDATAVSSNFFMMTRIADGTGTPLDERTSEMSEVARETVGVNELVSRRTQPVG